MLKKLHFRLTLLCAGIPVVILLVLSCIYLHMTEKNLRDSEFASFEKDMNMMFANLEEKQLIPHEWLSQNEGSGLYKICIWDNGVPLLFNNLHNDKSDTALFDQIREYYASRFQEPGSLTPYYTYHKEFIYENTGTESKTERFYVCMAFSSRDSATLTFLVLKSLAALNRQILEQRLFFILLFVLSAALLFLFASFFTKKLLVPIEEGQKRQLDFISSASHELRTPLTVLLSAASACEKAQPKEQAVFLKIIRQEGKRMSNLIQDLLTLAEADRHSFPVSLSPTELDTLLLDTYEAFEPLAAERRYLLSIRIPSDALPPALCDGDRIRQVLEILIENAFAHTPPGSHIVLTLETKDHFHFLSVEDNGSGIPPAQRPHIFDRFFRLDSSRTDSHFGLGLSIAHGIIMAHQGEILIKDSPLGGAAFIIKLPIAQID